MSLTQARPHRRLWQGSPRRYEQKWTRWQCAHPRWSSGRLTDEKATRAALEAASRHLCGSCGRGETRPFETRSRAASKQPPVTWQWPRTTLSRRYRCDCSFRCWPRTKRWSRCRPLRTHPPAFDPKEQFRASTCLWTTPPWPLCTHLPCEEQRGELTHRKPWSRSERSQSVLAPQFAQPVRGPPTMLHRPPRPSLWSGFG